MKEIINQIHQTKDHLQPYIKKYLEEIDHNPSLLGLHCPLGYVSCPCLNDIINGFSPKKVFIAIPYSNYAYEESIRDIVDLAGLTPIVVKDRLETQIILCKVCKYMRMCSYGIADFGNNNLNVVYEIGLMQSLGKTVAILKPGVVPGDLQGIEYLNHDATTTGLQIDIGRWLLDNVTEVANKTAVEEYLKELAAKKYGIRINKGK